MIAISWWLAEQAAPARRLCSICYVLKELEFRYLVAIMNHVTQLVV